MATLKLNDACMSVARMFSNIAMIGCVQLALLIID